MNKLFGSLTIAAAAFAASPASAQVTFYEAENFAGQPFTANGTVPNFVDRGFNDRARSAVVDPQSAVEICRDINFSGGCTTLNPGRYPTLGEWNGRISSVRPVAAPRAEPVPAAAGRITFYEAEEFEGRSFTFNGAVPNFVARGFNDRAESAVIEGTAVELCVDVNFGGRCTVLQPGRYSSLGEYRNRISSVRPVAAAARRDGAPGPGRGASATLYGGPNLTGRAVVLDREGAADLDRFSGRASSLVVERGYWIFCTQPDFRGECRTFGPGEYRQLPADFDNAISSGRRIANNYPYGGGRPNWEGNR